MSTTQQQDHDATAELKGRLTTRQVEAAVVSRAAAIRPTPTETGETFGRVAGIAAEHGLHVGFDAVYTVCCCTDATHPKTQWSSDSPTKDDAVREYGYVGGPRHILRRQRMTLMALTEVTPW